MKATEIISSIESAMRGATPGPWHAGHFCDDEHSCTCKSICDEGYAGGIATIHVGNDAPPAEEAKANLRFIAACHPENISALMLAYRDMESDYLRRHNDAVDRLEEVMALRSALTAIIDRSNNGDLGTSKVNDMRRIAQDALSSSKGGET